MPKRFITRIKRIAQPLIYSRIHIRALDLNNWFRYGPDALRFGEYFWFYDR